MTQTQTIENLEFIIRNYTTIFIVFDILFVTMIFVGVLLLIRFLKSKKSLQDSNEYLLYTIHGQEEERERIARELHDTIAQDLRYCKNLLEKDKRGGVYTNQAIEILEKTLSQVRIISYNLSPADITKKDLKANLVNLCASMSQTSNVKFKISIPDETDTSFLNENDILNIYRIVQESFTNVVKHANATEAVILIRNSCGHEEKGIYIFISDDGSGFDYDAELYEGFSGIKRLGGEKHFGLIGMKKRCQLIGAEFSVYSAPGEGTQVSIFKRMRK
ncbi:MAG: sensor histidine kinase [Treponema sp.]